MSNGQEHKYNDAQEHLSKADSVMRGLISRFGAFVPRPHVNYYHELVSSIIGQQLSIKAAETIQKRFLALFDNAWPSPEQILQTDADILRAVGMSRPKASYVIDLAKHIHEKKLEVDKLPELSNEEVVKELTAVKGIGEWTAHMFLIFALGRLDILPTGDLGFRTSLKRQYGFENLPTPAECRAVADKNNWHPYESVATWYLWQSLDNKPATS